MSRLIYQTLRESVVDAIRMKIVNQELKSGDRIVELELAEEFQTSRGPIREALRQLENEGLVEYTRNVGCSVRTITLQDAYEIYYMRASYEVMAIQLLNGKIPEETLCRMEEHLNCFLKVSLDRFNEVFEYDNAFHGELVKMVNLPRLYKAWKELNYGNMIAGISTELDRKVILEKLYDNHKKILDACKEGDSQKLCNIISAHYWRTIVKIKNNTGEEQIPMGYSWERLLNSNTGNE